MSICESFINIPSVKNSPGRIRSFEDDKIIPMKTFFILMSLFALLLHAEVRGEIIELHHDDTAKLFSIKAVILKGVKWSPNIIKAEMEKVNKIFSQCNVQIKNINLLTMKYNADFSDIDDIAALGKKLEHNHFKKTGDVVVVFAGKLIGDLRAEGGVNTGGVSITELSYKDNDDLDISMKNMAILLDHSHSEEYKALRPSEYSPIAHELGHILLNVGHSEEVNLMATGFDVSDELTNDQCSELRSSSLVK